MKTDKNSVMIVVALAEFRICILLYSYKLLKYKLNKPDAFSSESVNNSIIITKFSVIQYDICAEV